MACNPRKALLVLREMCCGLKSKQVKSFKYRLISTRLTLKEKEEKARTKITGRVPSVWRCIFCLLPKKRPESIYRS